MAIIGFAGLGNMGSRMTANLVKAGHTVRGYDPASAVAGPAREHGVDVVDSVAAAAAGAQVFMTMLPNGAVVREVLTGEDAALARLPAGALVIDSSSIDLATTRDMHAEAADRGLHYLDAPVSGGIGGAAAGTLTFMVGGSAEAVEQARPVLAAMGSKIVHIGGPGNGQAAKVCNNLVVAASTTALAEAFVLADRLGVDAKTLFDVMSTSSANCWSLLNFTPWPGVVDGSAADDGYRPRFAARLMNKDLHLALAAAEGTQQQLPLTELVAGLFARLAELPRDVDTSAVIREVPGYARLVPETLPDE
jgi:3-hydroxyisobutyrate dehydrogenase